MMRHAVFMLLFNTTQEQLDLSRAALESVLSQDIGPLDIYLVNNGSSEPTREWLNRLDCMQGEHNLMVISYESNQSPSKLSNLYSAMLFEKYPYVLGVPNDVILPPNLYSELVKWPRGFVCASMTGEKDFPLFDHASAVSENTPMCVMLTRRWAYEAIMAKDGHFFDENIFLYTSDCDLALRMASCGIRGVQLDIQFYHYGSASHRLASPPVALSIRQQADRDRAYFKAKWGFSVDALEYGQRATDINFRGVAHELA